MSSLTVVLAISASASALASKGTYDRVLPDVQIWDKPAKKWSVLDDDIGQISQEVDERTTGLTIFLTTGVREFHFAVRIVSVYPSLIDLMEGNTHALSSHGKT